MKSVLTKSQAKMIVNQLMENIPYNINIMNESGVIIASGDITRLGNPHKAAQRAIAERRIVEVHADSLLEKKGTNEPIIFEGEVIGVVGISGEPSEVRPFTSLVKTVVLLLLEELNVLKKKEQAKQAQQDFFLQLLKAHGNYSKEMKIEALEKYDLNLDSLHYGILAHDKKVLVELFPATEIFSYNECYLIFVESIDIEKIGQKELIISDLHKDIGHIVESLWKARYWALFTENSEYPHYVNKTHFLATLFNFSIPIKEELLSKVSMVFDETYPTMIAYLRNNCTISETAQELFIHRNTMHYRLKRIEEQTGKNPMNICDFFELLYYYAYIFYKRN